MIDYVNEWRDAIRDVTGAGAEKAASTDASTDASTEETPPPDATGTAPPAVRAATDAKSQTPKAAVGAQRGGSEATQGGGGAAEGVATGSAAARLSRSLLDMTPLKGTPLRFLP